MTRSSKVAKGSDLPAVFLDRDGVINKEVDHLRDIALLRILPGVAKAIKALNKKGYRIIVVTNQSLIAKGMGTEKVVEDINIAIGKRLQRKGSIIDAFYYCPHHPGGSVKEYSIECWCRKPNVGMIKAAAKDFGIDLGKSFLVGDKTSDILAGKRAGLRTILVMTGHAGNDNAYKVTPDFVSKDLFTAVKHIH